MPAEIQRVYVVDDDPLVGQTIVDMLEGNGIDVSRFTSGPEFLAAAPELEPGCLLLDVKMPEMDGLDVLNALADKKLAFPTVMISGFGDISTAVKAVKLGAVDFVEKPFSREKLWLALKVASEAGVKPSLKDTPLGVVTARELEVIRLLVNGDPNKVVAHKLGISERTVEVHRAKIMSRLEIRTFAELVRLAVTSGL